MLILLLKIICLSCLTAIFFQDFKERQIVAWLLIITIITMSLLYFLESNNLSYLLNVAVNLGVLFVIIAILSLYARLNLKQPLNSALGLGDILFFAGLALSFPVSTFLILFSGSLLFALLVFLSLKPLFKKKNVPLAGLQAIFFALVYGINWSFQFTNLYTY